VCVGVGVGWGGDDDVEVGVMGWGFGFGGEWDTAMIEMHSGLREQLRQSTRKLDSRQHCNITHS